MTWLLDERSRPIPVRAERAGSLTSLPVGRTLPELVPVVPEPPYGDGEACAWLTAEPVAEPSLVWRRLARTFDGTGLWPLATTSWERPFRVGEVAGPGPVPDARTVFLSNWEGIRLVKPDGTRLPHPPWPGLAPPSGPPDGDVVLLPDRPDHGGAGHLLLVPATRPADAVAQLGWYGACNWSLTGADISAVLRTWEDRFGAYLVSIGFAEFDLVLTRPPVTDEQCLLLADEHYAFCPDNFSPQTFAEPVLFTREEYADQLRGARRWHFWWD
jgi:hypothetical protein